jgi:hypothetical protein
LPPPRERRYPTAITRAGVARSPFQGLAAVGGRARREGDRIEQPSSLAWKYGAVQICGLMVSARLALILSVWSLGTLDEAVQVQANMGDLGRRASEGDRPVESQARLALPPELYQESSLDPKEVEII